MNKSKMICKETGQEMVTIPMDCWLFYFAGMNHLHAKLGDFIAMWRKEEKLKQHHRPYLEVRREMEKMCDYDQALLDTMAQRMKQPVRICNAACVHPTEDFTQEELARTPDNGEEVFNAMLEDLLTVMEYVDTQNLLLNLMEYGVPLHDVVKEFSDGAFKDMERLLTHWEQYAEKVGCTT